MFGRASGNGIGIAAAVCVAEACAAAAAGTAGAATELTVGSVLLASFTPGAAERRARLLRFDRQFALDKERRAMHMQRPIDRNRAARRQRNTLRAYRFILVRQRHLAEEDVRAVLPAQFVGTVRILLHPLPDI